MLRIGVVQIMNFLQRASDSNQKAILFLQNTVKIQMVKGTADFADGRRCQVDWTG